MRDVWIAADNIISPLGSTSSDTYKHIRLNKTGISLVKDGNYSSEPVYLGLLKDFKHESESLTKFESIAIQSIRNALYQVQLDTRSSRVIFILSTTKGNIELLKDGVAPDKRIHLPETGQVIVNHFGNTQKPLIISNACISGVMALIVARRLLQTELYDHAVVVGADVLTRFVISGFQCLKAISNDPCKPFDINRNGVNLGEAAATMILSVNPESIGAKREVRILGGALSNDANHISGPSRTGEELAMAVKNAIKESAIEQSAIDFISAHGTATKYNDEMEAKAFNHVGLSRVPLNSLKGYFGHTLGAAGIVEAIISKHALVHDELLPTFGFQELGVSQPLNILKEIEYKKMTTCLKTASGFGGCNAAIVMNKV